MTIFDALKNKDVIEIFKRFLNLPLIRAYKNEEPILTKLRCYNPENDAIEDQRECIFDFLTKLKLIVNEYCGWGKSFIVTAFIKICLELKLNKILNKPMVFVLSAPLTSLTKGNQLEKDLTTLFVDILKKEYNIKICNMCSGNDLLSDKNSLFDLVDRFLHNEKKNFDRRKCYEKLKHLIEDVDTNKIDYYIKENSCDAILIYTCDNSLVKLNNLNANLIDFLSLDEAHIHFLNGGKIKEDISEAIEIANSVIKLIEKNPNMIVRSWTATPTYLKGCVKSTWNRKVWGEKVTYTSYDRAIDLKWALPIQFGIYHTFDGNKIIDYNNFIAAKEPKKISYIFKSVVKMVDEYKKQKDAMTNTKLLVKCDSFDYFKNIYKIFEDYVENNGFTNAYANNPICEFINAGGTVIATSSRGGFVLLNKKEFKEFSGIPSFIAKTKDKTFFNNFLSNDVIAFNIKQFSTGHDLNFFNCGCIMDNCDVDDFIQFLFRSGRLDDFKKMNFIFISTMCCNDEHVFAYKKALEELVTTTDAFQGVLHCTGKGESENNEQIENELILFDKKLIELDCKECGKIDTRYKNCTEQTIWDEYRRNNRKDALKHLNDEKYKIKIVKKILREMYNKIDAQREYND